MHKFIDNIVAFSLKNKFFIFFCTAIAVIAGVVSFKHTPIDAFPDVTNTKVTIITQWAGRSAEEVEKFITIPVDAAANDAPLCLRHRLQPLPAKRYVSAGDLHLAGQLQDCLQQCALSASALTDHTRNRTGRKRQIHLMQDFFFIAGITDTQRPDFQ